MSRHDHKPLFRVSLTPQTMSNVIREVRSEIVRNGIGPSQCHLFAGDADSPVLFLAEGDVETDEGEQNPLNDVHPLGQCGILAEEAPYFSGKYTDASENDQRLDEKRDAVSQNLQGRPTSVLPMDKLRQKCQKKQRHFRI